MYVFDREGNNFFVNNTYDVVQNSKIELIDKEFIKAPMSGILQVISVKAGDQVKKGDVIGYIKSMKLDYKITAPEDTEISEVLGKIEQFIENGQPIFKKLVKETEKK